MKADLTRSTFRAEKHYSGVRMQQGRVQLDADWNEQVDIDAHLDETTRTDVIGRCGVPIHDAGFAVEPLPGSADVAISAGRAYVDGILCENEASPTGVTEVTESELTVESVVLDGRELEQGNWVELSASGVQPIAARLAGVSAADRRLKLEVPLTQAEQDALQKAGDAVLRRLVTYLTQPYFPGDPGADDQTQLGGLYFFYLDVWQRQRTALEDGAIREVALGGPDHATRTQVVWQVKRVRLDESDEQVTCATVPSWEVLEPQTTGRLRARAHPQTTPDDLCTIPPGAGYRRGENQLYRVEVRDGGPLGKATFTFSRENGSVVVPWIDSDTDTLTVTTVGRDEVLGFGPGDWVEATDDRRELNGEPGTFVKVKTALDKVLTIDTGTATGSLDVADFTLHRKVRRWDDPAGARVVETAADNDGYLQLEDGVEVRFEDGEYRALDYWLVAARTALGDVEWPVDSAGTPLALPPEGVEHRYCGLGLMQFNEAWSPVEDCRKQFPPLTELPQGGAVGPDPGVHVVKITTADEKTALHNDWFLASTQLADGIAIHCDTDIEPGTLPGRPTCLVTLDLPFPWSSADRELFGEAPIGTMPLTLRGGAAASGTTIVWKPADVTRDWLLTRLPAVVQQLGTPQLLVHLRLRGRFVYEAGNPLVNVDGEAFGFAEANGRLDALFLSGDGRRGGDLELWFRLRPGGSTEPPSIVIAVPTASTVLTSKAKRAAVSTAIAGVTPRDAVTAALPEGFEVNAKAAVDPARARNVVAKQRLAPPETTPKLVLAVEEPLQGAAKAVVSALRRQNVPLRVEVLPVPASELENVVSGGAGQAPDLLLVSQDTLDALKASRPDAIAEDGTVVL
jgi:Family of unknown function (DUF6519)